MEDLYYHLWEKKMVVVKSVTIPVPLPQLMEQQPGYGVDPAHVVTAGFPGPGLTENVQEQEFKVLQAGAMLPCGSDVFLVRSEYDILDGLLADAVVGRWSDGSQPLEGPNLDFRVSGDRGTEGKSVFLSYILARRLAMGLPTVYREDDLKCFLFDQYSSGKQVNADTLFGLPIDQQQQLWILTDDPPTDQRWSRSGGWFVVLAAATEDMKFARAWETKRNVGVHTMTHWKWSEIFGAFWLLRPDPPTPSEIGKLYTTFICLGPVARTCLQSIPITPVSAYNGRLRSHLGFADIDMQNFLTCGAYKNILASIAGPPFRDSRIMEPAEHALFSCARIYTRWLAHRLFRMVVERSQRIGFGLYPYFARHQSLRSLSGWTFEACVQYVLNHGGSFNAQELPIRNDNSPPFTFTIKKSQSPSLHYFTTAGQLARRVRGPDSGGIIPATIGKYFLPYTWRPESIDGLIFSHFDTLILVRIAIGDSLTIDFQELCDLLCALPTTISKINIVFVVPEAETRPGSDFMRIPGPQAVIPKIDSLVIHRFQWVCTYDDMQAVALD
ncbi:unnamed protein product, partial [Tuber aestivum]